MTRGFELLLGAFVLTASLTIAGSIAPVTAAPREPAARRAAVLVRALDSPDGIERTTATRELFRLGGGILPLLANAGAQPMATASSSRLDDVYSLLRGLPIGDDVRRDSFGVRLSPGATRQDVVTIGRRQGFTLPADAAFVPGAYPNCYVRLLPGHGLEATLRNVLEDEPLVVSVILNRVDR